jgi:DNA-binding response OmpR family regulator
MKILLLEDEVILCNSIKEYLEELGHKVDSFYDGKDVLDNASNDYDLFILDINVPTINGFDLLEGLNNNNVFVPTIYMSALVDIEDITKGYSLGCSDYIKKPFHLQELALRINQVTKTQHKKSNHMVLSKNYSYDKESKTLYFKNEAQNLTKKQQEIIHILALNIGMIVDFEKLRVDVWNSSNIDNPTIRAEISRLKKSLKEDFILNTRGLGYRIEKSYNI